MQIAELNIGRLVASIDDPRVKAFADALDAINALAERSEGFVWRFKGDGNSAVDVPLSDDGRLIPNMSVWETVQDLEHYVFNTVHHKFYARRDEWFEVFGGMHFVMWSIPDGHIPTMEEALARLAHIEQHGDTDDAFGWAHVKEARLWHSGRCVRLAAE